MTELSKIALEHGPKRKGSKNSKSSLVDPKRFESLICLSKRNGFFDKRLFKSLEAFCPLLPNFHYGPEFSFKGEVLKENYHIPSATIEKACRRFFYSAPPFREEFIIYSPVKDLL